MKPERMKCVRRESIEEDFDISEGTPIPAVPRGGARVKVCYAGATYSDLQVKNAGQKRPKMPGVHDTSLFPGFEVSGVVDEVCNTVTPCPFNKGDRVIVYPDNEDMPDIGYDEYIVVKDVNNLIHIPPSLDLQVASLLPTGALRAYAAIIRAQPFVQEKIQANRDVTNLLIVGAGGLGLWTLLMAKYVLGENHSKVHVTVADTNIEKLIIAKEHGCFDVIHWNDAIHEEYILERTRDVCKGGVDVAIDFVSSPRTIKRSLKVLGQEGVLLVGGNAKYEVTFCLNTLAKRNQSVLGVSKGSRQQLLDLVDLFAQGKMLPPTYTVFPVEEANKVFSQLGQCKLSGRAVLQVCPEEDAPVFE